MTVDLEDVSRERLVGELSQLARAREGSTLVLESCHSTWIFDMAAMRFRRLLKGIGLDAGAAATEWRQYYGLELDPESESFVVLLNPEGTRRLRSWRHLEHCQQCGEDLTEEFSIDDLKAVLT